MPIRHVGHYACRLRPALLTAIDLIDNSTRTDYGVVCGATCTLTNLHVVIEGSYSTGTDCYMT